MNEELFKVTVLWWTLILTPWKAIGFVGTIVFFMRWPVQMVASRRAGKPVVPRLFWLMSIVGSFMLLAYFTMGKNDAVGILSNFGPGLVAVYNLYLDVTHKRGLRESAAASGTGGGEGTA